MNTLGMLIVLICVSCATATETVNVMAKGGNRVGHSKDVTHPEVLESLPEWKDGILVTLKQDECRAYHLPMPAGHLPLMQPDKVFKDTDVNIYTSDKRYDPEICADDQHTCQFVIPPQGEGPCPKVRAHPFSRRRSAWNGHQMYYECYNEDVDLIVYITAVDGPLNATISLSKKKYSDRQMFHEDLRCVKHCRFKSCKTCLQHEGCEWCPGEYKMRACVPLHQSHVNHHGDQCTSHDPVLDPEKCPAEEVPDEL